MRWLGSTAAFILGAACVAGPPSSAPSESGRGQRTCGDIFGLLHDPSPAGRAVHARPDSRSRVLGRIAPPSPATEDVRQFAVAFAIEATRDGWLLVSGAGDDPVLTERPARPMYSGRGWIRGEGVRVGLQTSQAFAQPRHSSAILVQSNESNGLDGVTDIVACDGEWVLGRWRIAPDSRIRYEPSAVVARKPLTVQAWATGICNIQETSCDGVSGDRPGSRP